MIAGPVPHTALDDLLARFRDAPALLTFDELMIIDDAVNGAEVVFSPAQRQLLDDLLAAKHDGWALYLDAVWTERERMKKWEDRFAEQKKAAERRYDQKAQRYAEILRARGRDRAEGEMSRSWLKVGRPVETTREPTDEDALSLAPFVRSKLIHAWDKKAILAAIDEAKKAGKPAPFDFAVVRETYSPQFEILTRRDKK